MVSYSRRRQTFLRCRWHWCTYFFSRSTFYNSTLIAGAPAVNLPLMLTPVVHPVRIFLRGCETIQNDAKRILKAGTGGRWYMKKTEVKNLMTLSVNNQLQKIGWQPVTHISTFTCGYHKIFCNFIKHTLKLVTTKLVANIGRQTSFGRTQKKVRMESSAAYPPCLALPSPPPSCCLAPLSRRPCPWPAPPCGRPCCRRHRASYWTGNGRKASAACLLFPWLPWHIWCKSD